VSVEPLGARVPARTFSLGLLREQLRVPDDCTDAELGFFGNVCSRFDLSPFADQIVLIGRWDKRVGRNVYRHQLTVAGRRTLATRTGRPYRSDGPVWCGPRSAPEAPLVWREVWDDDEHPPYAARVLIYFPEFSEPAANGTAKWDEMAQWDGKHEHLLPTWAQMPSLMLGKTAESLALRRAFPDVIEPVLEEYVADVDPDRADVAAAIDEAAASATTSTPGQNWRQRENGTWERVP
jgi:hypothetical protein